MRERRLCELVTPFEGDHGKGWTEYPRPQMRRESYLSLCGPWGLAVKDKNGEAEVGEVLVPFPPESRLSGIKRTLERGEKWVYRKHFTLPEGFCRGKVLLHFGAVDQIAEVEVNGRLAGEHEGGYLPFTVDVTGLLEPGENLVTVTVTDDLDPELPYGKQRRRRGGMWYTPVSGIWQPVWLESVPVNFFRSLRLTPDTRSVVVETEGGGEEKKLILRTPAGERVYTYRGDRFTLEVEEPVLWTPEEPYLYEFTLTDGTDEIESYFALRTVTIEEVGERGYICLNGKPVFLHGLLDQGYYSDGIFLPGSPEGYRRDIETMKGLGFNLLRKHVKVEPELFYYYCDRLGMLVFQDMVNSGKYHYLVDTALPTLFLKRGVRHRASERRRARFEADAAGTAALLYNHPSVIGYTIFNEGWGQYDADGVYRLLKALDPGRVWNATSGWFTERESDVDSHHVYFKPVKLAAKGGRPLVLSEFGGYSCKIAGHAFNLDKTYGYAKYEDVAEFGGAVERLYREEIVPAIGNGLCMAVLTQVSDVEDETNGLVTYDRQVVKVEAGAMKELAAELEGAFRRAVEEL